MATTKVVRYIGPEKCTSRTFEIANLKPTKTLQIDGSNLSIKDTGNLQRIEPHGIYENLNALRRRGVALHFADVMSWDVHEKYISRLFDRMSVDPPPGYGRASLTQVLRADRESFTQALKELPDFARDAAGILPLDRFFVHVLQLTEVSFHLLPLPLKGGEKKGGKGEAANPWRPQPYTAKGSCKDKGKGNTKFGLWKMPAALKEHGAPCDDNNEALCYGYNLGTCTNAPSGGKCDKGRHVCCHKGCFKVIRTSSMQLEQSRVE